GVSAESVLDHISAAPSAGSTWEAPGKQEPGERRYRPVVERRPAARASPREDTPAECERGQTRLDRAEGVAGGGAVGRAVGGGDPARAGEAPLVGDGGDGPAARVGDDEVLMGAGEPNAAQVLRWRGVHVPPEGELDGTDSDERGGGDVRDADVPVGVL